MKRKTPASRRKLAKDVRKIAALAPLVAASRINKLTARAARGKSPLPALSRMGAEKASVAVASTSAMMFAAGALMTRSAFAFASAWSPWAGSARQRLARIQCVFEDAPMIIAAKGIAPVRKKVAANSRSR